ncbi:reverse transcriptase domain-containing protein [Sinorhizobium meliloti]|uniref:reverse transcriptase domain-containing protein n=1 Tax=Rhizobium meliloti TaxID=382 RepID=UPI001EFF1157|nr:reverse transcriptase domain-containing protein [Sinorhizobium meliloti]
MKANKGAAGADGLSIEATAAHLRTSWPDIRERVLAGTYRPMPVRRVTIPKPDGGERELGIPTVTDRLIQQALLQVLQPLLDPTFSEHSHGFRPGRSAVLLAGSSHRVISRIIFLTCHRRYYVYTLLAKKGGTYGRKRKPKSCQNQPLAQCTPCHTS